MPTATRVCRVADGESGFRVWVAGSWRGRRRGHLGVSALFDVLAGEAVNFNWKLRVFFNWKLHAFLGDRAEGVRVAVARNPHQRREGYARGCWRSMNPVRADTGCRMRELVG
ncbi:MAG: hypothetical protein F4Y86_01230 [Gammaproteobacteria bacterium]|nr:hypothetical protein [Gammaproteobacteria bacterium]